MSGRKKKRRVRRILRYLATSFQALCPGRTLLLVSVPGGEEGMLWLKKLGESMEDIEGMEIAGVIADETSEDVSA